MSPPRNAQPWRLQPCPTALWSQWPVLQSAPVLWRGQQRNRVRQKTMAVPPLRLRSNVLPPLSTSPACDGTTVAARMPSGAWRPPIDLNPRPEQALVRPPAEPTGRAICWTRPSRPASMMELDTRERLPHQAAARGRHADWHAASARQTEWTVGANVYHNGSSHRTGICWLDSDRRNSTRELHLQHQLGF